MVHVSLLLSVSSLAFASASYIPRQKIVSGKTFDRIAIIWNENTDYDKAAGDPNLNYLAKKGQILSNYFAVTHPSEPNYVASIGGDNFGMQNDDLNKIASNVSSVIDLLEEKGISWGAYQEDMPYTGYEGFDYRNQKTQANDYVRKHNPPVIYDSVATVPNRLSKIKNTTLFWEDLENDALPQWMFITPNMTSDGHDTSVTVAGAWTRNFLEPLLNNKKFMKRTLVLVTFDENHTYTQQNRVFSFILGDALPKNLVGTTDSSFYDHYSEISTVEANWGLHTLGRWDTGANVFKVVGDKSGDKIKTWTAVTGSKPSYFLNESYAGPFNSDEYHAYPVPNVNAVVNGRSVLQKVKDTWGKSTIKTIYNTGVEIPDAQHPPAGY